MIKIIFGLFMALTISLYFSSAGVAAEKTSMAIKLGDKSYSIEMKDNVTIQDILEKLPLSLNMKRYAGHEYYAELPFRPAFAQEQTSHIQAGHLYYWDGWNAFVINYEESDITPYKVVHLGHVDDAEGICGYLRGADENIDVTVEYK